MIFKYWHIFIEFLYRIHFCDLKLIRLKGDFDPSIDHDNILINYSTCIAMENSNTETESASSRTFATHAEACINNNFDKLF